MGNRKIIFLDVDGTLVDYETKLPDSAREAVQLARKKGHRVYICTGRSEAEVYGYIWEIGLDGIIGGNGAYVKDGETVILWRHLTGEQCRRIVDWLQARSLAFYLEANSGLYASPDFEEKGEPAIRAYAGRKGKDSSRLTVRDVFPDMVYDSKSFYREDLNKVSFVLHSYQDYLDCQKEFPDLQVGTWGGAGETALFGDIGIKGIDKGVAIDRLLAHLGASLDDTFAFGDAKVDIPMLQKCAVGVAMGSGGEEIKAMADYVTDGVQEDGLYKAFAHFGLL